MGIVHVYMIRNIVGLRRVLIDKKSAVFVSQSIHIENIFSCWFWLNVKVNKVMESIEFEFWSKGFCQVVGNKGQ